MSKWCQCVGHAPRPVRRHGHSRWARRRRTRPPGRPVGRVRRCGALGSGLRGRRANPSRGCPRPSSGCGSPRSTRAAGVCSASARPPSTRPPRPPAASASVGSVAAGSRLGRLGRTRLGGGLGAGSSSAAANVAAWLSAAPPARPSGPGAARPRARGRPTTRSPGSRLAVAPAPRARRAAAAAAGAAARPPGPPPGWGPRGRRANRPPGSRWPGC